MERGGPGQHLERVGELSTLFLEQDALLVSGFPDLDDVKSLAIGAGVPIAVRTTGGLVAGLVVDSPSTPGSAEVVIWDPSTGGGRRWQVEPDATVLEFHD